MPIEPNFPAAIQRLAGLAGPENPAYIAVRAACKLAEILSPAHPRHGDIMYALNGEQHDHYPTLASQTPSPPTENPCAVYVVDADGSDDDDEASSEEEDEPL